ncbi:GlmS Glucosamine 6-phosphate synthetase, contains amidotransferase and phosphosugar isomerase domains [Fimbriimonadaceae bacterium]
MSYSYGVMCGIAGYVGERNGVEVAYDQLKRLEYRGYDSAGIAVQVDGRIDLVKKAGTLNMLAKELELHPITGTCAIGHSRWATHGGPTDLNAHPHFDGEQDVVLVHNGIIENYLELKEELMQKGHTFLSQTDTEVAAHVIGEEYRKGGTLLEAVRHAVRRFRGAYAFVVMSKSEIGTIVAVRNASPLVLGLGQGENLLASDIPALLPYTRQVVAMEEGHLAELKKDSLRIVDGDGRDVPVRPQIIEWDVAAAERGGYEHFMLKEIHEQPQVIRQCLAGRLTEDRVFLENIFSDTVWNEIDRVNIIACGTAFHAGLMGKHLFEKLLRLPTDVYFSSEFRYGDPVLSPKSLAVFVSQSGETADTLAALRLCKSRRIRTLGIVNVVGSSIARECDRTIFTQAGPEISVASTKAYTAQVLVLSLLALHIAQVQETPGLRVADWVEELRLLSDHAQTVLTLEPETVKLAEQLKNMPLCFFLGRGADAYVGYEGALKLKEIAYIPTQESPAGEMKHGPLALVEAGVGAIFGATDPSTVDKVVSNIKEIQARAGTVLSITSDTSGAIRKASDHTLEFQPTRFDFLNALLSVIPMQLLAYHIANAKGCSIDQPRNLAKSVTVE